MEGSRELVPRPTYPRSHDSHATTARKILNRHEATTGSRVTLPIPIEMIVEQTYGLEILWADIPEPPEVTILGALAPREKRIVLNSRHESLLERWMGPERFTLAHELAHWTYDADDPNQLAFDLGVGAEEQYCYHRESPGLSNDLRIREVNANKLAAHLLLPEDLVRAAVTEAGKRVPHDAAARWRVSRAMLEIRLRELGLAQARPSGQLRLD